MSLGFLRFFNVIMGVTPTLNGFGLPDGHTSYHQLNIRRGASSVGTNPEAGERWHQELQFADYLSSYKQPGDTAQQPKKPEVVPTTPKEFVDEVEKAKLGLRGPVDFPLKISALGVVTPGLIALVIIGFFHGLLGLNFMSVANWYFYIIATYSFFMHLLSLFGFVTVLDYLKRPYVLIGAVIFSFVTAMVVILSAISLYAAAFNPEIVGNDRLLNLYRNTITFAIDQEQTQIISDVLVQVVAGIVILFVKGSITPRQRAA